jgi:hypothetical protein
VAPVVKGRGPNQHANVGGGFGLRAMPAGMYVIKNGEVSWRPALDINRIIAGAQIVVALSLLTLRAIMKARRQASMPIGKRTPLLRRAMLLWRLPSRRH